MSATTLADRDARLKVLHTFNQEKLLLVMRALCD